MSTLKVDKLYAGDRSTGSDENVLLNDDGTTNLKGNTTVTGTCAATTFSGSGASLTNLPAANLTGTLPAISGANLTSLPSSSVNPNLLINGDMRVSQRGTSEAIAADGWGYFKVPDRWRVNLGGATTVTVSQDTDSPEGFANSIKYACTTIDDSLTGGENVKCEQRIEARDLQHLNWGTSDAEAITLSFWVKTNKSGTYWCNLVNWDNCSTVSKSYTVSDGNWNKYSVTFPANTSYAVNNDNGRGLDVIWYLTAGPNYTDGTTQAGWYNECHGNNKVAVGQVNWSDSTSNVWNMTGAKLEVGSTATDFNHESYAEQLRKCQRYYQRLGHQMIWAGRGNGSSSFVFGVPLPVALRAASPTITMSGTLKTFETDATSESTNTPSAGYGYGDDTAAMALVQTGHSGLTDDRCINGYIHGTGSYLALECEL